VKFCKQYIVVIVDIIMAVLVNRIRVNNAKVCANVKFQFQRVLLHAAVLQWNAQFDTIMANFM